MKRFLKLLPLAAVLAASSHAQPMPTAGYVDTYIVKVKPEKRADFEAVSKKIADANRRHKGSTWLAYVTEYGDNNTVSFSSLRENYASIDKASAAFMSAMKEGYGPAFPKVFQDMNNCLVSSRAEIRRRRPDLSSNVPDPSAMMKNIGESKWVRYFVVRVKAGHNTDYEENIKMLKTAFEKQPRRNPILVSQSAVGQTNGTYYFASFWKSLADLDSQTTNLRDLLGSDFDRYQKGTADHTISSEWSIARISPELSNPPKEIADANPDFWKSKPAAAAAKPKAKASPSEKPGA